MGRVVAEVSRSFASYVLEKVFKSQGRVSSCITYDVLRKSLATSQ